ncbi:hypothetical protein VN97_g8549 [Penicillium thymicola]|uniref:Uncharacterized protein n=1 Tax=Penicillium thymicola TaxID=293382 RepID=A0AAI9X5P0_PENTH|nr:hypothetical protein VN97_g8549 [Penicillium thymicola]
MSDSIPSSTLGKRSVQTSTSSPTAQHERRKQSFSENSPPTVYHKSPGYLHSPPKLAAKRSANFLQIQFRFHSDSIQIPLRLNSL